MFSSTSPTNVALCLLLAVAVIGTIGAASAESAAVTNNNNNNSNKIKRTLPGSCLMAASTLCANADTNAMRCLRKLAIAGDARVPSACAEALMTGVTANPRRLNQASRTKRMARMLNEGGNCDTANSCPASFANVEHNRCNDVQNGCGGCPKGTFTVLTTDPVLQVAFWSGNVNPNNMACSNICCKGVGGAAACCICKFTTRQPAAAVPSNTSGVRCKP